MKMVRNMWISFSFKSVGQVFSVGRDLTLVGGENMTLGNKVSIGNHCILTAWNEYKSESFCPSIIIGDNSFIGDYNHITSINSIILGEGVLTGRWVTITDNAHGFSDFRSMNARPLDRKLFSRGPIKIGNNVWIGDKVTILPDVTIGDGCIIAANTVVANNIPPYCVVAGEKGKIVKQLQKCS